MSTVPSGLGGVPTASLNALIDNGNAQASAVTLDVLGNAVGVLAGMPHAGRVERPCGTGQVDEQQTERASDGSVGAVAGPEDVAP